MNVFSVCCARKRPSTTAVGTRTTAARSVRRDTGTATRPPALTPSTSSHPPSLNSTSSDQCLPSPGPLLLPPASKRCPKSSTVTRAPASFCNKHSLQLMQPRRTNTRPKVKKTWPVTTFWYRRTTPSGSNRYLRLCLKLPQYQKYKASCPWPTSTTLNLLAS